MKLGVRMTGVVVLRVELLSICMYLSVTLICVAVDRWSDSTMRFLSVIQLISRLDFYVRTMKDIATLFKWMLITRCTLSSSRSCFSFCLLLLLLLGEDDDSSCSRALTRVSVMIFVLFSNRGDAFTVNLVRGNRSPPPAGIVLNT